MKSNEAAIVYYMRDKMKDIQAILSQEPVDMELLKIRVTEFDTLLDVLERQAGQEMER